MSRIPHTLVDRPKYRELKVEDMGELGRRQYDIVQMKYDGMWGRLVVAHGQWAIYSRNNKLKKDGVLDDKNIDFELIGEYINNKNHPIHHNQYFHAYDILSLDGMDLTDDKYSLRYRYINKAIHSLDYCGSAYLSSGRIRRVRSYNREERSKIGERLWDSYVINEGWEGLVFKDSNATYFEDFANIRIKKECEIEYMCIGFDMADPESKYAGQVGAVRGSLFDKPTDVKCGGLSEAQRKEYTANPEKYVGQVFTAKGNGWFTSGSIRHPKFSRWREDKTMIECSYDQLPEGIRSGAYGS